jgi:hypothetical protein
MAGHARSIATEVHALLIEAHPQSKNVNLIKAAHLAEASGEPGDPLQLETFVAIRNIQIAIDNGAGSAETGPLLLHAIDVALRWASA